MRPPHTRTHTLARRRVPVKQLLGCKDLHCATPLPGQSHAIQIRLEVLVVGLHALEVRRKALALGRHVLSHRVADLSEQLLVVVQLVRDGTEEAVAVGADL